MMVPPDTTSYMERSAPCRLSVEDLAAAWPVAEVEVPGEEMKPDPWWEETFQGAAAGEDLGAKRHVQSFVGRHLCLVFKIASSLQGIRSLGPSTKRLLRVGRRLKFPAEGENLST